MDPLGYQHHDYALSLREFGEPQALVNAGGWLLKRSIPESNVYDAMGCYPLFSCLNWERLYRDLDELKDQWVTVSFVTDPFAVISAPKLNQFFKDVCVPFKEHFVIDLSLQRGTYVSNHHKRYTKKALNKVEFKICEQPEENLKEWVDLYSHLIRRHSIKGIPRFSPEILKKQMNIPGCIVFQAMKDNQIVGMQLWYQMQDKVYYHLGASNDEGYRCYSAFAIFWEAIDYFKKQGIRWLSLGSGAGVKPNSNDGLSQFKRGWANTSRTVYFCGAITQKKHYENLIKKRNASTRDYFPGYRTGEFA